MEKPKAKYIIVTGGNMSGLGKGTAISSIGVLLLTKNILLTTVKIDPYLNVDAGTMSPYEHGEVFVLDDGGEVDLDLGNYERFLDIKLSCSNNITSGKIYEKVIHKERRGEYLGRTVQVVPHVTDCIKDWISDVIEEHITKMRKEKNIDSKEEYKKCSVPCVCLIEVGGTVGDIESAVYLEALQQLINSLDSEDVCLCHLSHVPIIGTLREQKTKPAQHSVRILREAGLRPDFIFCRCEEPLTKEAIQKISLFSQVKEEHVISLHNTSNLYKVPLILEEQNVSSLILKKLKLENMVLKNKICISPYSFNTWKLLANRYENATETVVIGIVGKYTGSNDTYLSVISALVHACLECGYRLVIKYINSSHLCMKYKKEHKKMENKGKGKETVQNEETQKKKGRKGEIEEGNWKDSIEGKNKEKGKEETDKYLFETYFEKRKKKYDTALEILKSVDGVLVPGGFGTRGIEGKYFSSKYCRLNNVPYLGICLGMQTAIIDVAMNYLNPNASSEEFEDSVQKKKEYMNMENIKGEHNNILPNGIENEELLIKNNSDSAKRTDGDMLPNVSESNNMSNNSNGISNHYEKRISNNCDSNTDTNGIICSYPFNAKIMNKIKLLGIKDFYRSVEEIDNNNAIISMPEFIGENAKGGSMRLGLKHSKIIDTDSLTYQLYDQRVDIYERHRHRYEINPKYVPLLECAGLSFVAKDCNSVRMEVCEIKNHKFFIGVQFHPEFTSKPFKANPIFLAFILAAKGKLNERLQKYKKHLYSGISYQS